MTLSRSTFAQSKKRRTNVLPKHTKDTLLLVRNTRTHRVASATTREKKEENESIRSKSKAHQITSQTKETTARSQRATITTRHQKHYKTLKPVKKIMRNSEQRSTANNAHQRTTTPPTHTRPVASTSSQSSFQRQAKAHANFKFTAFADTATAHRSRFKLTYGDDVKAIKTSNATNDFWSTAKSRAWIRWSHLASFTLLPDSLLVNLRITLHIHASPPRTH